MTQTPLRLLRHLPARVLLVASLVLGFALPVVPAFAVDGEDAVRSAQMRRWRRRRRRRPRRPPPEAVEAEATEAEAEGELEGEGENPPAGETDAEGASVDLAAAAEGDGGADDESGATTTGNLRRSNRMEFDARLVRGQTAGAGAVVLFNRGNRPLPPLTRERHGFSRQTVREVLGVVEAREGDESPRRRRGRGRVGRD